MSRIGKLPITLPAGTTARMDGAHLIVKGPKGELKEKIHDLALLELSETTITVSVAHPTIKTERAIWGLFRSLINNMVVGVNQGYEKKLEVNGVGYRAAVAGDKLTLNVGYSHPVEFTLPKGISAAVAANVITLTGIDKYLLGETAAQIRKIRKPEPYKGKGIKYADEIIRRKAGKTAAKGGK